MLSATTSSWNPATNFPAQVTPNYAPIDGLNACFKAASSLGVSNGVNDCYSKFYEFVQTARVANASTIQTATLSPTLTSMAKASATSSAASARLNPKRLLTLLVTLPAALGFLR